MNSSNSKLGIVNLVLMFPALFLCTSSLLIVGFKLEFVSDLLGQWMGHKFFGWVFSPVVILGGPAAALLLSTWKIFRVSAEKVLEEFVIVVSIKRWFSHWVCVALASGLILLVLAYGFVENFQIVAVHR